MHFFKKSKEKWCLNDVIYSSWDIEQNILKLVILGHFLPFNPHKKHLKPKFWKMKKFAGDIIILYICTKNHNHMMYGSWYTERDRDNFLSFWTIFCTFTPLTHPKNQDFEKMKKTSRDIIILHICTINDSHMMHVSGDIECNGQNFLSFWSVFCFFTPLTTQKNKVLKKMEKLPGDIIILHRCNINDNHMMYGSCDTKRVRIFCHFGPFFAFLEGGRGRGHIV